MKVNLVSVACIMVKCQHIACTSTAHYGDATTRYHQYCAKHKLAGMKHLDTRYCDVIDCNKIATYSFKNEHATKCGGHKISNMLRSSAKYCEHEQCTTIACFGLHHKKPTHCKSHAAPSMKNVVSKLCCIQECNSHASHGQKKLVTHCRTHSLPCMKRLLKCCKHPECEVEPKYGISTPEYCFKHKSSNMTNLHAPFCQETGCVLQ